jgi:hypothetical protein
LAARAVGPEFLTDPNLEGPQRRSVRRIVGQFHLSVSRGVVRRSNSALLESLPAAAFPSLYLPMIHFGDFQFDERTL